MGSLNITMPTLTKPISTKIPQHIAIVMDGNGRWAKRRHMPRVAGHRAGAKVVREIVEHCVRIKLPALTLFAFSIENQQRPKLEVDYLMSLFFDSLQKNIGELHKNNVKLRIIGDRSFRLCYSFLITFNFFNIFY